MRTSGRMTVYCGPYHSPQRALIMMDRRWSNIGSALAIDSSRGACHVISCPLLNSFPFFIIKTGRVCVYCVGSVMVQSWHCKNQLNFSWGGSSSALSVTNGTSLSVQTADAAQRRAKLLLFTIDSDRKKETVYLINRVRRYKEPWKFVFFWPKKKRKQANKTFFLFSERVSGEKRGLGPEILWQKKGKRYVKPPLKKTPFFL